MPRIFHEEANIWYPEHLGFEKFKPAFLSLRAFDRANELYLEKNSSETIWNNSSIVRKNDSQAVSGILPILYQEFSEYSDLYPYIIMAGVTNNSWRKTYKGDYISVLVSGINIPVTYPFEVQQTTFGMKFNRDTKEVWFKTMYEEEFDFPISGCIHARTGVIYSNRTGYDAAECDRYFFGLNSDVKAWCQATGNSYPLRNNSGQAWVWSLVYQNEQIVGLKGYV